MSDEKIIMDKDDYHIIRDLVDEICKNISKISTYEYDIPSELYECMTKTDDVLDKAEPYERMNNTMSDSTYRSILRFLDHISKYSETTSIDYDIIEIKVLLKQLEIDGDK